MSNETAETARDEFARLQTEVLEWYGAEMTDEYVELDRPTVRTHVLSSEGGDPVVLIHGGGDEAMLWAPLLARMQGEFALYAPDRPGCGLSDGFAYADVDLRQHATDFVCSLLDALGIDRAAVIACSAGAYFAFVAALDRPERFRKLVFAGYPLGIVDAEPLWASPAAIRNLQLVGGMPGLGKLFGLMQSRMDAETVRELYEDEFNADVSKYPDLFFDAKVASVTRSGATESFVSFIKRCYGLRGLSTQADLSNEVSDLDVPSLFLWGEHDLASPETGREAVAPIPEATFEVVERAGHFPFHDAPDWSAERMAAFLRDAPDTEVT